MKFYMPTRVFDDEECVHTFGDELAVLGNRALIVCGRHSAEKSGALDDVTDVLKEHGRTFCIFREVEENPSIETVIKAAEYGVQEGADFCIGVGGGSAMDAAKAIAFLMKRAQVLRKENASDAETPADLSGAAGIGVINPFDLYNATLPSLALPVAAVPTTCGTGSEVTGVSVLTVHEKQTKMSIPHRIFPTVAFVDGKYLKAAPRNVIVNTAVDALAHMIESYGHVKADDYSRAAALAGLWIWSTCRDLLALQDPSTKGWDVLTDTDRSNLMSAATFAGIAIAQTGTSVPHALSYTVTYDMHMAHGRAAGYFLPGFLQEMSEEDRGAVLAAAGFHDLEEFRGFMRRAFPDMEVPEDVRERAVAAVASNKARLASCRFACDETVLRRIAGLA